MKNNTGYTIFFLIFSVAICVNCASTLENDVRFGYLTKQQPGRQVINDVFFNETNSKYIKYRLEPEKELKPDEAVIFDEKKLPKNNFRADDDWMKKLLEALENEGFFKYARSAKSLEIAEQFFLSNVIHRQCLILEVDDNVSIAFPPESVLNSGEAQRKKFQEDMNKFKKYVEMFIATSHLYRKSEAKVGGGIETLMESQRRHRENIERELESKTQSAQD